MSNQPISIKEVHRHTFGRRVNARRCPREGGLQHDFLSRCGWIQSSLLGMRSSVELEEKWGLGYVKQREQERAAAAQRALGPDPAGYPSRAAGTD
jgi:hypothetical protein